MIQLGCLARFFNRYENEVKFAKENNYKIKNYFFFAT